MVRLPRYLIFTQESKQAEDNELANYIFTFCVQRKCLLKVKDLPTYTYSSIHALLYILRNYVGVCLSVCLSVCLKASITCHMQKADGQRGRHGACAVKRVVQDIRCAIAHVPRRLEAIARVRARVPKFVCVRLRTVIWVSYYSSAVNNKELSLMHR